MEGWLLGNPCLLFSLPLHLALRFYFSRMGRLVPDLIIAYLKTTALWGHGSLVSS